jgi:putative acetyltransferase
MRIEPLRDETIPEVKALIAGAVLEFYGDLEFLPKTVPELLRYYGTTGYLDDLDAHASVYSGRDGIFLAASENGTVVGCGGIRRLDASNAELVRLWFSKEWRGKGLGRMLFDRLMLTAADFGFKGIHLDTSFRCADALRLFRRNGFGDCPKYKESIADVFLYRRLSE